MQTTNIHWAVYSINFVTGCTRAGPECDNCYAEEYTMMQASRDEEAPDYVTDFEWDGDHEKEVVTVHDGTPTLIDGENDVWVPTEDRRKWPYEYTYPKGPGTVFDVSMGDLFHRVVPDDFIIDCIEIANDFPEHIWIFLTKRPGRAAEIDVEWPSNAWIGTSVGTGPGGEYPDMTHRIEQLRQVDAETRWVSAEPLIEPLGEVDLDGIDWMVVGGESAPADVRREMNVSWAQDLHRQAREQDVAFFYKQGSARYPGRDRHLAVPNPETGLYEERKIEEYPPLPDVTVEARGNN